MDLLVILLLTDVQPFVDMEIFLNIAFAMARSSGNLLKGSSWGGAADLQDSQDGTM